MHSLHQIEARSRDGASLPAAEGGAGMLRVVVCDDSRTYAAGLRRLLESGRQIEVVAVHESAESAIAAIPGLRPDLVTMDVEVPGMSGFEAVERIMTVHPVPILVLSSRTRRGHACAAAAYAAGAADAWSKDDLDLREPSSALAAA